MTANSAEMAGNSKTHLKRSNFTNLAQYLSGSPNSTPPPLAIVTAEPAPVPQQPNPQPAKRRKTTPRKHESVGQIGQGNPAAALVVGRKQPTPTEQKPTHLNSHHYSGSTSSLTASPASPPHSHSTEGGDGGSIEDTDRSDNQAFSFGF